MTGNPQTFSRANVERIATADGACLAVRALGAPNGDGPLVIFNTGFGVRQVFYLRFLRYLQSCGFAVVTYDYRGIGESSAEDAARIRLRDWTEYDFQTVLSWSQSRFPGRPTIVLGHSFGGQFIGHSVFIPKAIAAIAMICSPIEDCRRYGPMARARLFMYRNVAIPIAGPVLGYFPGKRLRISEDLPLELAKDWRRFSGGDVTVLGRPSSENLFNEFNGKVLSISVADDLLASESMVSAMTERYGKATKTRVHLQPRELGVSKIGHHGLFSLSCRQLWPRLADDLGKLT